MANRLRFLFPALLSGLLYVISFAPWNQGYLQWIAFIPLFLAADALSNQTPETSERKPLYLKTFLLGFVVSVLICAGGFYWIIYATQEYGELPFIFAFLLFLAFCVIGQLQVPIYLIVRTAVIRGHRIRGSSRTFSRVAWLGIAGLVYAGIECLYPKLFLDTAGNAFSQSIYFRQGADIGGPFFLTALIILVNELFTLAIRERKQMKKALPPALTGIALIALLSLYGSFRVSEVHALQTAEAPKLRLALIQGNIGDYLKIQSEHGAKSATQEVMSTYISMSKKASEQTPKPDAIVWPETAYPNIFGQPFSPNEYFSERALRDFAGEFARPLIFGGYDHQAKDDFNSIFIFNPGHSETQVYHKAILLMFGETLPFAESFPAMKSWFPTMGFFGRGPGPELVHVNSAEGHDFALAPQICYEGLYSEHSATGALMGADALLNVTNDSWFGPRGEPDLHLALTIFRSIETRLPMIRATNTGITTLVDPTGGIVNERRLFEPAIVNVEVESGPKLTSPYLAVSRFLGPLWFHWLCEMVAVIALLFLI